LSAASESIVRSPRNEFVSPFKLFKDELVSMLIRADRAELSIVFEEEEDDDDDDDGRPLVRPNLGKGGKHFKFRYISLIQRATW
jgi:hypothetical protein